MDEIDLMEVSQGWIRHRGGRHRLTYCVHDKVREVLWKALEDT